MKNSQILANFNKIHFVGVGGVSMSALAEYTKNSGLAVSGSDIVRSTRLEKLSSLGIDIRVGHSVKNLKDVDAVVYSVATDFSNPELTYAKRKNIPILTRGEYLGKILSCYKNSVAVSGCHGKTTTSAMISNTLMLAGKDPTAFLGGDDLSLGNFRRGSSEYAVAEACEYKRSFLSIKPKIAVVLNVDDDHLDTYENMDALISTYRDFIGNSIAVVNADDLNCKEVFNTSTVTFGIENRAHYYASNVRNDKDGCSFTLNAYAKPCGRVKLKMRGKHNVYNALATFAVCDMLGVSFNKIKKSLEQFKGVKRRNEYLGEKNGVKYFADYAHHPKELKAMLNVYEEQGETFATVFQPHTYSRTKLLMQDFVSVLKSCSPLIIYKTYSAREEFDQNGSAYRLYENLLNNGMEKIYYAENQSQLENVLNECALSLNKVVVFGAGDIYDIVKGNLK